jgi:hypothetical protein
MHVPGKEVHQYVPDALQAYARTNMPPKPVVDAPMPILIGHTSLKVERPLCLLNGR